MDVSSYFVNAVIRQMAETDAAEAEFAKIDDLIADTEGKVEYHEPLDEAGGDSLGACERREVDEAMRLVYGGGESRGRDQDEVA